MHRSAQCRGAEWCFRGTIRNVKCFCGTIWSVIRRSIADCGIRLSRFDDKQTVDWFRPSDLPPPHPPCLQYTSIQKFDTSHFYFSPFKLSNSPMCLTIVSLGLNPNFLLPAFEFPDKQRKTSGPPNIILNPPQAAQITHRSIRLSPLDIMRLEICTGYQKKWVFCLTLQKPQTEISEIQIDSAVIQIKVK